MTGPEAYAQIVGHLCLAGVIIFAIVWFGRKK